ncbi:MAG: TolC family protein, partial [Gemmataceae bacterium]
AKSLLLEAQDRYAALAIEIRSEVRLAFSRMALARKKVEFYKRAVLPVQQTVTDQTQVRYNGMILGVFQLLQAKQEQIDAGRDFIQSLAEYWMARAELEKAIGRRLPTGPLRPSTLGEPKVETMMMHHHK